MLVKTTIMYRQASKHAEDPLGQTPTDPKGKYKF